MCLIQITDFCWFVLLSEFRISVHVEMNAYLNTINETIISCFFLNKNFILHDNL